MKQEAKGRKKRMTEKEDQERGNEGGEERKDSRAARRFTRGAYIQRGRPQAAVAAVAAVEHTAKATPTQRMNGRQREGFSLYVPLTRIYVSIRR